MEADPQRSEVGKLALPSRAHVHISAAPAPAQRVPRPSLQTAPTPSRLSSTTLINACSSLMPLWPHKYNHRLKPAAPIHLTPPPLPPRVFSNAVACTALLVQTIHLQLLFKPFAYSCCSNHSLARAIHSLFKPFTCRTSRANYPASASCFERACIAHRYIRMQFQSSALHATSKRGHSQRETA